MMRSFLFVPAKERMLAKIGMLEADAYIIDLEDSVEEDNKAEALVMVEEFLKSFDMDIPLFVRVNKENVDTEVERLSHFSDVGFMLPKFEYPIDYGELQTVWEKHKVIALVETPLGVVNIEEIAKCSWIDMIAFGAEDYTTMVNMENSPELLIYQKSRLVTYAKAYGKYVLDTPSFQLDNHDLFNGDIKLTVKLGFDGKLAISPKHISHINRAFLAMSVEEIEKVIKQYEENGAAVQVINGVVYEKMHIKRLKDLLRS